MEGNSRRITTRELWARLFKAPSIDSLLSWEDDFELPSLSDYLAGLCEVRDERPEAIINRSGIDRSFGHRIFSGKRNPSRDTVLQLAFGLQLSTDDAQQLLKVARVTALHPKVKRDAVIAYCLHNGKTLIEAQEALHECGLPLLGGARHE